MSALRSLTLTLGCWLLAAPALATPAQANEDYERWPLLADPFPSTGGGGIMIHGYKPVVADGKCTTPFTARTPTGESYPNIVEFTAVATQGGILCSDGRWRSADGSATGTTPFRVFIKDGVLRGSP
jgi:hypothetical protein